MLARWAQFPAGCDAVPVGLGADGVFAYTVVTPAEKAPTPVVLSVGPLNPYATELDTPVYSAMDRRMNIFGRVTVQIELDETGKVITAKATDGAKSLRTSAEEAVRKSKFRPVKSGTTAVKATGFIVFNFVNQ